MTGPPGMGTAGGPPGGNESYYQRQQYQQPYGTPQPGYVPQPPPKKSTWKWILGGVGLALAIGCVGLTAATLGAAHKGPGAAGDGAPAGAIGAPARDGRFEFTVTTLKCGQKTVGSGLFESTAQGSYCLVTVKVSNIGKEAQTFDGSAQKAFDAKGTQYSDDGVAELNLGGNKTLFEQINPGNGVTGTLVYDVPVSTKLASIELHDSSWSDGVKVPLK
jgi:hypothetical protein